ncbi:alkaline phosphatase family protein [Streptomyces sp. BPTC-684]|uniref:alkaline phosphatase family protein n=1 Tax=Streptomyces sp. BPTC-684 TaxID=3043734 RepID=UPI0024B249C3|nr:alkaline phosphatase family protein [Streptomyces sp. BPTC-684]WHM40540.1 alkaline phosphatase family protein [Streptomyces sp. BPTC-684]
MSTVPPPRSHRARRHRRGLLAASSALAVGAVGLWAGPGFGASKPADPKATALPKPDHVVVVMFENQPFSSVIKSPSAPYINSLAKQGALLTASSALSHPSQPNYYQLFSGSTQGAKGDDCPKLGTMTAPNLGSGLIAAGRTWGSYNEDWPSNPTTCKSGKYAVKHNPWFGFKNVPASTAHTFTAFPKDYTKLPAVSFVVPNLCNDMHGIKSGCKKSVATGDSWLKSRLDGYAQWAKTHNSVLVVTFDEGKGSDQRITTIFEGGPVKAGATTATKYNHYDLLRTIEDMYGVKPSGQAASGKDITGIWK